MRLHSIACVNQDVDLKSINLHYSVSHKNAHEQLAVGYAALNVVHPVTPTTAPFNMSVASAIPSESLGALSDLDAPQAPLNWDEPLNSFGFQWSEDLTIDENFMDYVYRVSRNSICTDGHMGCAVVRGIPVGKGNERVAVPAETVEKTEKTVALCHPNQFEVLVSTTNTGLFGKYRSDVHAEANAMSHFAKCGHLGVQQKGGVQVTSCYVTRAPCSNCYSLIASAGIRRIVCPQNYTSRRVELSAKHLKIEWVVVRDNAATRNARDQDALRFEDKSRIQAMRLARKEMKKQKRAGKRRKLEELERSSKS